MSGISYFDDNRFSAASWIIGTWNERTDYTHGWMIPIISMFLIAKACQKTKVTPLSGSLQGMWLLAFGALMFLVALRTVQPRIAIGSLPFFLTGAVWCYWGRGAAKQCAFPFFFLWLTVPIPGIQQSTIGMQILSTQLAHHSIELCGIRTIVEGTSITFADANQKTLQIAEGCSGMRSLLALFMYSCTWGYLADKLSLWKRITLALSAIPLSIIVNAFRITSIFICAKYINLGFASKTWHDWSSLLFFFPASLLGLMLLHGILSGEIPFLKRRRAIIKQHHIADRKEDPLP